MHRLPGMEPKQPVLVAVDGSGSSIRAAQLASELACGRVCTLVLAYVEPPQQVPADAGAAFTFDSQGAAGDVARKMLEEVRARCEEHPPAVQLRVIQGNPAEALATLAHELDAWLLVVGTRGRGAVAKLVLGSTSDALLKLSSRPVLIVP
jgi:nucleotide-binding universal stress UspA family protein